MAVEIAGLLRRHRAAWLEAALGHERA